MPNRNKAQNEAQNEAAQLGSVDKQSQQALAVVNK